ncbi:GCN5-related N-acetyltransferase 4, chloroplastic-like isoform X2 [Musa acuminata AAA Group]|uniref:GCN5-related N-acetyltransferase 4, chloroplastic-like isoform X2 n=1 Tax=Musa acuminata AAA Group TaxID=214697 RepID=UPI0031DC2312
MALTPSLSCSSSPSLRFSFPSSPLRQKTLPLFLPGVRNSNGCGTGGLFQCSTGTFRAGQAVELFPSLWPEVTVRDVQLEDYWEVADTHCSCFFPNHKFPINFMLRINRFVGLFSRSSVPPGKFGRGSVAGILTVDTVADFLPRKGPLRQRRTGVAYISNVAVRKAERRKGIAKMLIAKAEARARSWGCRSMALHCDSNNLSAIRLYKGQGYKCIKVPENANWPEPRTSSSTYLTFMMKLLNPNSTP